MKAAIPIPINSINALSMVQLTALASVLWLFAFGYPTPEIANVTTSGRRELQRRPERAKQTYNPSCKEAKGKHREPCTYPCSSLPALDTLFNRRTSECKDHSASGMTHGKAQEDRRKLHRVKTSQTKPAAEIDAGGLNPLDRACSSRNATVCMHVNQAPSPG